MNFRKALIMMAAILVAAAVILFNLNDRLEAPDPEDIEQYYRETMYYQELEDGSVQCEICFRECIIPLGEVGFCRNRRNVGGTLYNIVHNRPSAVQRDPVEKEPQHHFLPGSEILCIGTASCNFRCKFCQNWSLSQQSIDEVGRTRDLTPEEAVQRAVDAGIPTISFTYNEPTVFYEYMYETAKIAQEEGLNVIFHSNGSMNPAPLRDLLQHVDAVTIDLKGFSDEFYSDVSGAELEPVLQTLRIIREEGVWLEIVNLVVPTYNDDPGEIREMCAWIYNELGPQVPLHFSRFFPAYQLTDLSPTPVETLEEAHRIAREEGLSYVSIGNVPGHEYNSTFCPECDLQLIGRYHFTVTAYRIDDEGRCPECGEEIPGVWQ